MNPNELSLFLALALFMIGCLGFIVRKNMFVCLMSIELMLNGVNVALVSAGNINNNISGQVGALFFIVLAVAETAVGLALIVSLFRTYKKIETDVISEMKH